MPDPFKYYRRSIHDLLGIVRTAIANRINRRPDAEQWQAVEDAAIDSMSWADILAAGALRWRGLRQTIVIPVEEPTWEQVADSNWWAKQQSVRAAARIAEEAERFANRTKQYVDKRMQSEGISSAISRRYREVEQARLADEALARRSLNRTRIFVPQRTGVIAPEQRLITPEMIRKAEHKPVELSAIPEYAVRRFERDSVGTIANDAEQLAMNDPEVGDSFPFARYFSRDDARVRPTHRAMAGTVAQRCWEGWRICRPLCGFSCRCGLRQITRFEAVDMGYLSPNGFARFMVRWSNTMAERNFASGVFPDAGWKGPKFVASAAPIPIERVA